MRYRIDQDQLWEFLARQAKLVERLPALPPRAGARQAWPVVRGTPTAGLDRSGTSSRLLPV